MVKRVPTAHPLLTGEQLSHLEISLRNLLHKFRRIRHEYEAGLPVLTQIGGEEAMKLIPIIEKKLKFVAASRSSIELFDYIDNPGSRIQLLTRAARIELEWCLLAWTEGLNQLVTQTGSRPPTDSSRNDIPTADSLRCKLNPVFFWEEGLAEQVFKLQEDPALFLPQFLVSTDAPFLGIEEL